MKLHTLASAGVLLGVLALASGCNAAAVSHAPALPAPSPILGLRGALGMGLKALNQPVRPMTEVRHGNRVTINMYTEQRIVTIAPGVRWAAWTFDGTVPGPVIHLEQGDRVTLVLHNLDPVLPHSIDLHASQIAPDANYVDVMPGRSHTIRFNAEVAGVFIYHCASQPTIVHIEKGMYGEVVVQPKGLPQSPEFDIVQSEFYPSMNVLLNGSPEYVAFNGEADRYLLQPFTAKVGEPVRFAVVNAGPNDWSAFHVIGSIFSSVQPSGSQETVLRNLQTWSIAPGDGAILTVTFHQPGVYKFVTHSFRDIEKGAVGEILVTR